MNAQKLLISLEAQDENLDFLIESLRLQKAAIVNNNYNALEEAITLEQKALRDIEIEEKNRVEAVKEIAGFYSLELENNSLESLLKKGNKYSKAEFAQLQEVRASLKEKMEDISRKNTQLKDVIDFSRNMIKETIMILVGPNKRTLVNKRV